LAIRFGENVQRILNATRNTWKGLVAAARSEAAFREELVALLIAMPLSFFITGEAWKRAVLIGVVLLVMVVELLNTAIEKLCDHVTPAQHDNIGRIKDMGSAAVGVSIAIAGLAWVVAAYEWLTRS
jgi:diacylglycerol kinase (ATP)